MVQPLYEAMALMLPMEEQLGNLEKMRCHWLDEKAKDKARS